MRRRWPSRVDRGFFSLWTAVLSISCWALIGLVYDGGAALRERSRAFGVAAAAGRAGAQAIDEDALLTGRGLQLDVDEARRRAREYVENRGFDGTTSIDGLEVTVRIEGDADLSFLPGSVHYEVEATVRAVQSGGGVGAGGGGPALVE